MAGKVFALDDIMIPDKLASQIANQYISWENDRQAKVNEWEEIQRYIFATDTTKTSNSKLPWSNKTTIPKLCQIRDNLYANYMATLFPKRNYMEWEADTADDASRAKRDAITSYMYWATDREEFFTEARKLVADYIDYGNCFGTVDWIDRSRSDDPLKQKKGYVGPVIRRISPLDIVFNPSAGDFASAPKIVRSLVSLGEVKSLLQQSSKTPEELETAEALYSYLRDLRGKAGTPPAKGKTWTVKDAIYNVAGFDSFNAYLCSGTVEILTFFGDIYDLDDHILV